MNVCNDLCRAAYTERVELELVVAVVHDDEFSPCINAEIVTDMERYDNASFGIKLDYVEIFYMNHHKKQLYTYKKMYIKLTEATAPLSGSLSAALHSFVYSDNKYFYLLGKAEIDAYLSFGKHEIPITKNTIMRADEDYLAFCRHRLSITKSMSDEENEGPSSFARDDTISAYKLPKLDNSV